MRDLIDRKDLGAAIDNWLAIDRYYHPYSKQKTIPVSELVDIIKLLPSAQPNLQPTCNQLATDCISRQAAIKAIENLQDCYNGFSDTYDKACIIGVIEEIPTAQVNTPTNTPTDTISRQAAIDALGDEPEVWTGKDEYAQGLNNQWHYDRNAIKAVPSAQTEYRMDEWCTDCKEYDHERHCCPRFNHVIRTTLQDAQRTGRWKVSYLPKGKMKYCSECGFGQYIQDERIYRFCPNCGARMEVEE